MTNGSEREKLEILHLVKDVAFNMKDEKEEVSSASFLLVVRIRTYCGQYNENKKCLHKNEIAQM